MSFSEIDKQAKEYVLILKNFLVKNGLQDLPISPVDHCAVKLKEAQSFEAFVKENKDQLKELGFVKMNNRRLASALLEIPIDFADMSKTHYLEIMEPRPEKAGHDFVGLEHTEVIYTDLTTLSNRLLAKGIEHENYDNGMHKAVVIRISDLGHEIKFTDSSIADVRKKEIAAGNFKFLD